MDTLTPAERRERMSRVRGKDTRCELTVRRLAHGLGYRFRLHRRDLPGSPDLVFVSRRRVVFVHGCFWHRHPRCRNTRMPKSRLAYWKPKLAANVALITDSGIPMTFEILGPRGVLIDQAASDAMFACFTHGRPEPPH